MLLIIFKPKSSALYSALYRHGAIRYYSSKVLHVKKDNPLNELNPDYVSGLTDAEGTFIISITKKPKAILGQSVQLFFRIRMHTRDTNLLLRIQSFFKVGTVRENKNENISVYEVGSFKDLIEVIIPHFNKHLLITQKHADFSLFKYAMDLIQKKEHLTLAGLHKIVAIKAAMNKELLSDELKKFFPEIIPLERPSVKIPENLSSN